MATEKTVPQDIEQSTLEAVEARAFTAFKMVMEEAYKTERFKGVIQLAHAMLLEADHLARECEASQKSESMTLALVAEHVTSNWAPKVLSGLAEVAQAGGIAAIRNARH